MRRYSDILRCKYEKVIGIDFLILSTCETRAGFGMINTFLMKIDAIQPTQLYISSEKLNKVMRNLRRTKPIHVRPIPIKELDNQIVFVDGHTRAFAAFLLGLSEISVYWEDEELDWDEYRICVGWCKKEGINTISDLKNRVVPNKDYKVIWLDRCKKFKRI